MDGPVVSGRKKGGSVVEPPLKRSASGAPQLASIKSPDPLMSIVMLGKPL